MLRQSWDARGFYKVIEAWKNKLPDGAWQLRLSSENRPRAAFAFEMRLMPNEAIVLEKL